MTTWVSLHSTLGQDTQDGHCPHCLQEQIDKNVPVTSRILVKASECEKHGNATHLYPQNEVWVVLYNDIAPYHLIQGVESGNARVTMDLKVIEILCKHQKIDFNTAFRKLTIIHKAYNG